MPDDSHRRAPLPSFHISFPIDPRFLAFLAGISPASNARFAIDVLLRDELHLVSLLALKLAGKLGILSLSLGYTIKQRLVHLEKVTPLDMD